MTPAMTRVGNISKGENIKLLSRTTTRGIKWEQDRPGEKKTDTSDQDQGAKESEKEESIK